MNGRVTPAERAALSVVERLRGLGHEAYFAGGCVRDRLLGRAASDIDVATSAIEWQHKSELTKGLVDID